MATTTANASRPADPNFIDLSQFKGDVIPCPTCSPRRMFIVDPTKIGDEGKVEMSVGENMALNGQMCKLCLGQGYVSKCTNCDATGKYSGLTVWDGGKHPHVTTCNPCGGTGYFPTKKPQSV